MISNSNLQGVPLLVLANKQDLPGEHTQQHLDSHANSNYFFFLFVKECMGVREVKPIFQDNAENIGNRDCMVLPTSGRRTRI